MVNPTLRLLVVLLVATLTALAVALAINGWEERRRRARLLAQLRAMVDPGARAGSVSNQLLRPQAREWRWTGVVGRITPMVQNSATLLEQAGVRWTQRGILIRSLWSSVIVAIVAAVLMGGVLPVLGAAAVGLALPILCLLRKRSQRVRAFEAQLPDAIDLLGRAIRAGHSVSTGLKLVAEESEDPLAGEF